MPEYIKGFYLIRMMIIIYRVSAIKQIQWTEILMKLAMRMRRLLTSTIILSKILSFNMNAITQVSISIKKQQLWTFNYTIKIFVKNKIVLQQNHMFNTVK